MTPKTTTSKTSFRRAVRVFVVGLFAVAGLAVLAQTPAPGVPQSTDPQSQVGQAPVVPPGPDGRGAGGGGAGGRGGDPFAGADLSAKEPIRPQSVGDEQKSFLLMPGYRLEPVISEPDVEEPMQIAFDGNGRMFVLENRGYMQTADSEGELDPVGRISVHEDLDNDGKYERHTIFVDKLVFPRFVMPIGPGSILAMESNTDDVYKYSDTNGDGVADKKELFTSNFGRSGNVEHQQSSLFWGMDNWLYSTYNSFRVRWTPKGVLREPTGTNGSQWGITQDNEGKVWFQGGASGLPGNNFQFPIHYGNFSVNDQLASGLEVPWGVAGLGDYQPGTSAIRAGELTLNRVTGGAGNDVYRGDRLPQDLVGDYIYGEPVARIVRRIRPVVTGGLTQLRQVYQWQHAEFIRSTDHLFRPVDMATAPDGTLYIVDTYRGIIQEGNWTRPGSYLRAKVDQYQLDKVVRHGRIWRLTYDGIERDRTQPRLHDETSAQLVGRLAHPNGWWRDTAQQLLVLRQDKSVVPALQQMVRSSTQLYGRFHALWTLEGLGALDADFVREQMRDAHSKVRVQAIRASETLYKSGQRTLGNDYRALSRDPDADVAIQALLTLSLFRPADLADVVKAAQDANKARGIQEVGNQIVQRPVNLAAGRGGRGGPAPFSSEETAVLVRGESIYKELCYVCHGNDGLGAQKEGAPPGATMAPSLANSTRVQLHRDYVIKALLHGVTGPVEARSYSEVMVPQGTNKDEWIASIASYVRNSFGNAASFVSLGDVARVRAATAGRRAMWTVEELTRSLPIPIPAQPTWKTTASHAIELAGHGLNYIGWSSGTPQQPGMWYQLELPEPVMLTEIQMASTAGGRGGTPTGAFRGGGGGGRGDVAPPPPAEAQAGVVAGGQRGAGGPGGGGGRGGGAAQPSGYPRAYQVHVSLDGKTWGTPVAEGMGRDPLTEITFRPVRAKFIRITQTASATDVPPWSIQRLRLYEAGTSSAAR